MPPRSPICASRSTRDRRHRRDRRAARLRAGDARSGRCGARRGGEARRRACWRRSTARRPRRRACSKTASCARPTGFARPIARYVEGGWNALAVDPEHGGQGLPLALATAGRRDVELGQHGLRAVPAAERRRDRAARTRTARRSRSGSICAKLVSGEWTGTMNLTEPQAGSDLGALRTRGRCRERRALPDHRAEDLHHLWRPRPGRQHRPLVLARTAGCAAGQPRHLAVPRAEIPASTPTAASAQRNDVRCAAARAQARHPCLADLRPRLWRRWRRDRLAASARKTAASNACSR